MIVCLEAFEYRHDGGPKRGVSVYSLREGIEYPGYDGVADLVERAYGNSSGRSRDTRRGLEVRFDFDAYSGSG